ncbi:MAG TPA: class I SAM-dependent methyltransferase [Acidobacteriaceae bacterium]|nr:class I SAM-dependent methyltransferase [Acidobacteriaceae bacterium]
MAQITNAAPDFDPAPQFDRVARPYRWMEYLSFGPLLERCRFHHLAALAQSPAPLLSVSKKALVFGDGDGRFLARLLAANPELHADAVDASPAMLRLLRDRVAHISAQDRLTTTCADARTFEPAVNNYDLVATHFFLDCLTASETTALIARLRPHLAPGARWLVSEFHTPRGSQFRAACARTLIASLYAAFRILTGLKVRQIPPWQALLAQSGFTPCSTHSELGGLLVSELWQLPQATAVRSGLSHRRVPTFSESVTLSTTIPGIDPGPEPIPGVPPIPHPDPAPGPPPEPDPEPYPGPIPAPQPVTRTA